MQTPNTARAAAVLAVLLMAAVPVGAATVAPTPAMVEPRLDALSAELATRRDAAERVAAAARAGGLADVLDAVYAGQTEQRPGRPLAAAVDGLGAARRLAAAAEVAERRVLAARGSSSLSVSELLRAGDAARDAASTRLVQAQRAGDDAAVAAVIDALPEATPGSSTADLVDVPAILGAGRELLAVVDATLPALPVPGSAVASGAGAAAGCDVLDQPPLLCVGGPGANAYTSAYRVIVDQGGDDTYGLVYADRYLTSDPVGVNPVQVIVDQGGNDRYQGAGYGFGGVGITVDSSGNDLYEPAIYHFNRGAAPDLAHSYGSGLGVLGLGLLADLAGDDLYRHTGRSEGSEVQVFGQGVGFDGVGVLLDRGAGRDAYTVTTQRATATRDVDKPAQTGVGVQAVALTSLAAVPSAGLLFDDGGTGELLVDVSTGDDSAARIDAQANGATYRAFLLTGTGDTTYRVTGRGGRRAFLSPWVQAFGNAVLRDEGGTDRFELDVVVDGTVTGGAQAVNRHRPFGLGPWLRAQAQSGALLETLGGNTTYDVSLRLRNTATAADDGAAAEADTPFLTVVSGQGFGSAAALVDHGGDDAYRVTGELLAEAAGAGRAAADGGLLYVYGQGDLGGALVDQGGTNAFEVRGRVPSVARPTPHLARGGIAEVRSRGTKNGLFVDGGTDSRFVTEPDLGAFAGAAGQAASGQERGGWWESPWSFVWQRLGADSARLPAGGSTMAHDVGVGVSRGARPKAPVQMAFVEQGRRQLGRGRNDASVRLTDAAGQPLAGQRVLFEVEAIASCTLLPENPNTDHTCPVQPSAGAAIPTRHHAIFTTEAITDANGVATATFDVDYPVDTHSLAPFTSFTRYPTPNDLTLAAVYSGDASRQPAVASLQLRRPPAS